MDERMLQAEEADSLSIISTATEEASEDNSREDGEGAADSLTVDEEELEAVNNLIMDSLYQDEEE